VTRDQFVEALRSAATYAPKSRFPEAVPCADPTAACFKLGRVGWAPLPEQAPHLFWGYGWLDATVTDTIVSCALRRACPTKSQASQDYNSQRQSARAAAGLDALAPPPGDDAASGRDAGQEPGSAVRVVPGVSYSGALHAPTDWYDGYTLRGTAGQRLSVSSSGSPEPAGEVGCWSLFAPDGKRLTATSTGNLTSCNPGTALTDFELPDDGVYLAVYDAYVPHDYSFTFSLR
jgi:hypothetical protein